MFVWKIESKIWLSQTGNGLSYLPNVIYACFVLHNSCELNNESFNANTVRSTINYDQEFQPETDTNRYMTDCNETEGEKI